MTGQSSLNTVVATANKEICHGTTSKDGNQPSAARIDQTVMRRSLEEEVVMGSSETVMCIVVLREFVRGLNR